MWLQKFKKKDSRYVPYDRELVALSLLALLFLLLSPSYLIAQKVIVPGDDIVQVIQDSPAETIFQIEPGLYQINQPIDVNRSITLVGSSPNTTSLPTDVIIDGNNTYKDVIPDGDFEQSSTNWKNNINPPDPTDPSYSIIEENPLASSPTHLALFKGIEGTLDPDQIQQDFTFPLLQDTCPVIGYPEVWQDITVTPVLIGIDDFFTQPILFPPGIGPTGVTYVENTFPLSTQLPPEISSLVNAELRFEIMQNGDPVNADDRVEIYVKMGGLYSSVVLPLDPYAPPMTWLTKSFDVTPLIRQFNPGDIPSVTVRISKLGTGANKVYLDDFRVFLDCGITLEIPIYCGNFDNFVCPGWTGIGNWSIEPDPVGPPTDRCMMLGPSLIEPRDVWIELYVKTEVFGAKPDDKLRFVFDGGIQPEQVFIENVPGIMEPLPLKYYNPSLIPMNENYKHILLKVPVGLANDGLPHVFHLISEVTPSAETPTSSDFKTTIFSIDDIRFLIGPFPIPNPPEPGYEIINGDFELGNNGSWALVTNPPIPDRDIATVISPDGGHNAPTCVKLGGIPPAKISFYVKPVNLDYSQDSFKVWINDESNPDKVICDSQNTGSLMSGVWNQVERWLVPPLLNEGESSFSLHLKSCILSPNIDSYILFDDFCVNPYSGLGPIGSPEEVCYQNAIQNPSFEIDPDISWNKNPIASLMGPIHCYNPALSEECILPEPPQTGIRAIRFSAIAPRMNFWLKILDATSDSESKLEVLIDNQNVKTINATENTYWNNYALVITNDILPFIDGQPHTLKIQVSANECNKTPVRYLIDDICLGYKILLPGEENKPCAHNILSNPDFESGSAPWVTLPIGKQIIKNIASDAHAGVWYAQLSSPQLDTRELWQDNIDIPPVATKLQFQIRVEKGSAPEQTELEVYWDTKSGSPAWSTDASSVSEGDWQLEEIPLPLTPNPHTLYFVYKNCRLSDTSKFMIDDIAFVMGKFPLIQVFPGGSICIENLQLRKGSIGILDMGGSSKVYRCFIGDQLEKGIEIGSGGTATIAQSVIHGNSSDGIFNNGGTVAVFQSTIRSNSGIGVHSIGGSTYVTASLIWQNGGGLHGEAPVEFASIRNLVNPSDVSGVTKEITIAFDPADVSFLDSPWLGKLSVPIPARDTRDNILSHIPLPMRTDIIISCPGSVPGPGGFVDFENDTRNTNEVQVGADEVGGGGGGELIWVYCEASPVVPREITGRARDIGIGNEFTIEVSIRGNNTLDDATLYLVPEEYIPNITNATDQLTQIEKLPSYLKIPVTVVNADNQRGEGDFVIKELCDSDADGITFTTNGRARIYLRVDLILMGIGTVNEERIQFPTSDTEFVVDTVPPRLKEDLFDITARGLVINDNDNVLPLSGLGYPPDWGPYTRAPKAWSDGTLDRQTVPTAQMFFNNGNYGIPPDTLDYTIQAAYYDPYPVCNDVQREVEVSGFITNQPGVFATGVEPIIDLLSNGPIFPGFEPYRGFGCALINLLNDIGYILGYSANPVVNSWIFQDTSQADEYPQTWQTALVQWQWQNLVFRPDWHIRMRFGARDLSGNFLYMRDVTQQDALELWWMRDPVLIITSAPRLGEWTNNPQIQWRLIRSVSQAPAKPEPCVPIYGIRVWALNNNTSIWNPVPPFTGDWGWIINRESMDKNTPIVFSGGGSITLNKIITNKNYCGSLLMATLIGADEAGNVQYIPELFQNQISDSVVQSISNVVPLAIWRNPCEAGEVDTTLQTDTWWNQCRNVSVTSLRIINYNLGERDFGSSQRVPLPLLEDACDYRVEIKLIMGCILPSGLYGISEYGFDVQIYEDSNLLASGTVRLLGGVKTAGLIIPEDLIAVPPEEDTNMRINWHTSNMGLLNKSPKQCGEVQDRLGDEGSPHKGYRQRDVKYDFVARAFFIDPVTGAKVTDFTPAKATVTIYPPPGDTGGYSSDGNVERVLTAPSQPKEEQKIKMFQRE